MCYDFCMENANMLDSLRDKVRALAAVHSHGLDARDRALAAALASIDALEPWPSEPALPEGISLAAAETAELLSEPEKAAEPEKAKTE